MWTRFFSWRFKIVAKGDYTNMDQNKLLECMEEIKSIAQSQQNRMTKEEIHQYLSDMELHEDQILEKKRWSVNS